MEEEVVPKFNEPFLIDTVFKVEGIVSQETQEYKAELACCWEDILSLQSYPYEDSTWQKFPGPKFYMTLYEQGSQLCIGNFKTMFKFWKQFKKNRNGSHP